MDTTRARAVVILAVLAIGVSLGVFLTLRVLATRETDESTETSLESSSETEGEKSISHNMIFPEDLKAGTQVFSINRTYSATSSDYGALELVTIESIETSGRHITFEEAENSISARFPSAEIIAVRDYVVDEDADTVYALLQAGCFCDFFSPESILSVHDLKTGTSRIINDDIRNRGTSTPSLVNQDILGISKLLGGSIFVKTVQLDEGGYYPPGSCSQPFYIHAVPINGDASVELVVGELCNETTVNAWSDDSMTPRYSYLDPSIKAYAEKLKQDSFPPNQWLYYFLSSPNIYGSSPN